MIHLEITKLCCDIGLTNHIQRGANSTNSTSSYFGNRFLSNNTVVHNWHSCTRVWQKPNRCFINAPFDTKNSIYSRYSSTNLIGLHCTFSNSWQEIAGKKPVTNHCSSIVDITTNNIFKFKAKLLTLSPGLWQRDINDWAADKGSCNSPACVIKAFFKCCKSPRVSSSSVVRININ